MTDSKVSVEHQKNDNRCKWFNQMRIWLILLGLTLIAFESNASSVQEIDLDFLILSVRWIPSACISYKAKRHSNYCHLPSDINTWVVHGLWPQKGHVPGPFFCHHDLVFNLAELAPIRSQLENLWPNLYGGEPTESLWRHEWDKHGTCAVDLPPLRNQILFFNQTLDLHNKFNMNYHMVLSSIYPSQQGVMAADVFNGLVKTLGKTPRIKCSNAYGKTYISEIRMCFTKDLNLMDCPFNEDYKDCPSHTPILYPNSVDVPVVQEQEKTNCYSKIVKFLKIVQFLQWLSL